MMQKALRSYYKPVCHIMYIRLIDMECLGVLVMTGCHDADGLEDVLQAQLQTYAGLEEIESIASTCSRSMNSRGESETSHGPYVSRFSMSNRSTPGDSAHSSPGGHSTTGMLCMLCLQPP